MNQDVSGAVDMIRDSAAAVADRSDLSRIRALRYTKPGFDRSIWQTICELGWPALRVPEEQGGIGLGMNACVALSEELGAALVPEPLIAATLAARLVRGDELAPLLTGERLVLPAWQEERGATSSGTVTRLSGGRLTGTKLYISMAAGADAFLVMTEGGAALVDADAAGVRLETIATQDGGHYGTLHLDGASARPVETEADLGVALAEATLACAAYMLGMIDAAMTRTLDYLRTRVQFGKAIGTFQALQHRAVDLTLEQALTRASIDDAARRWDAAPGCVDALAAVSRAKARASRTAMLVTRQAIQLHGGIGYTDEHDIGLYLRKAMVLAPAYGDATAHRARYASLLPDLSEPV